MRFLIVGIMILVMAMGGGYWWYSSQILNKQYPETVSEVMPQQNLDDSVARLENVSGPARFFKSRQDLEGEIVATGGVLRSGQYLRVGSNGSVRLAMADSTFVEMGSSSELFLVSSGEFTLTYGGSVWSVGSNPIKVVTDAGSVTAKNAEFSLTDNPNSLVITVDKGEVILVDRSNQTTIISTGQTKEYSL